MRLNSAAVLALLPGTWAWGSLGHTTVAYIASGFVDPRTAIFFQSFLNDKSSDYLATIATWADSYRYTADGRFSGPLHFIDAEDNPPEKCDVVFKRDCGGTGCVVGAIGNYTTRLMNASLPFLERSQAAKFIVHFLGDIHQPLHDEHLLRGGNDIPVLFDGKPTNLHAVWDTSIPEQLMGSYSLPAAQNWSALLSAEIRSGSFAALAGSWLEGMDAGSLAAQQDSALGWARESNAFVCSTVLPRGKGPLVGAELNGTYYESAVPVVQLQVAKAGYRLAAWMNLIVTGSKGELAFVPEEARSLELR